MVLPDPGDRRALTQDNRCIDLKVVRKPGIIP